MVVMRLVTGSFQTIILSERKVREETDKYHKNDAFMIVKCIWRYV